MGGGEIIALITGFFKFFPEVVNLIKMLQDTPEEERQKLMVKIKDAFDEKKNNGRPG